MNRINNIIALTQAAATNPGKFSTLPLSAQTKVVFSCLNRVTSGIKWWESMMEDESNEAFIRQRAVNEVNVRTRCLRGYYDFLNRASHYSGGTTQNLPSLVTSGNIDDFSTTEDIEYVETVVNGNPYAWAKQLLVRDNNWNEELTLNEEPVDVQLFEVSKTYDKYFARYIATALLAEMGLYTPPQKHDDDGPSDLALIASCSTLAKQYGTNAAKSRQLFARQIIGLFKATFGKSPLKVTVYRDNERVTEAFTAEQLCEQFNAAVELDEIDAEAYAEAQADKQVKAETKQFRTELRGIVREAILQTTVMAELGKATADMAKAGVSDDVIKSITAQVMGRFAAPAPAQVQ